MKKIIAVFILLICLSMFGCGGDTADIAETVVFSDVYRLNEIVPTDGLIFRDAFAAHDGGTNIFSKRVTSDGSDTEYLLVSCTADGIASEVVLPKLPYSYYNIVSAKYLTNGDIVMYVRKSGGVGMLLVTSPDGETLRTLDDTGITGQDIMLYVTASDEIIVVFDDRTVYTYTSELERTGIYDCSDAIGCITEDADGNVYLHSLNYPEYFRIDEQSGSLVTYSHEGDGDDVTYRFGHDGKMYRFDNSGVYRLSDTAEDELILSWEYSGIAYTSVDVAAVLEDMSMFVMITDMLDSTNKLPAILTPVPDGENIEKKQIKIGVIGLNYLPDGAFDSIVTLFNNTSDEYHASIVDYRSKDKPNQGLDNFEKAVLNGELPDVLISPAIMEKYSDDGIFADLSEIIESSKIVLTDSVKNAFCAEDTVYELPLYVNYQIMTALPKTLDGAEFSYDKMYEIYESLGKDSAMFSAMPGLFRLIPHSFIDKSTGTCSFDSKEFIELLNFMAESDKLILKNNIVLPSELDPNTFDYNAVVKLISEDKLKFLAFPLRTNNSYALLKLIYGESGIDICGFPTSDGGCSFVEGGLYFHAVNTSKVKEGVADFISFLMSDRIQASKVVRERGFPISTTAAEALLEYDEFYLNISAHGSGRDMYVVTGFKDRLNEINEGMHDDRISLDDDDRKVLLSIVNDKNAQAYSVSKTGEIFSEEYSSFISGSASAETAAQRIQNRISIYLSE